MGIDYDAGIMVGVSVDDIEIEDFEADDHGLDIAGNHYSGDNMVVGVELVGAYVCGGTEFSIDYVEGSRIKAAKDKVRAATGVEPKLMLTLSVS